MTPADRGSDVASALVRSQSATIRRRRFVAGDRRASMLRMGNESSSPPDAVVIAQGGVTAMRALCDELRRAGLDAALMRPQDGGSA